MSGGEPPTCDELRDGETLPGDRGISPLSSRLGGGQGGKAVLLAALLLGSAAFLWATWDRGPQPPAKGQSPARQVVTFEPAAALAQTGRPTLANPGASPPSLTGPSPSALARPVTDQVPALDPGAGTEPPGPGQAVGSRPTKSPMLVYSRRGTSPGGFDTTALQAQATAAPSAATELDGLRQGSQISTLRAGRLADRNFLILAGAVLPCLLLTALDSTTPGFVSCVVPSDVYSDNGAVVLLEKGTRVLGEYRSASLKHGQRRIFVLWTRAVSPAGVSIMLSSPAADALGRSGIDGEVDRHFWDRFGGALLLSLVDDAAYAAAGSAEAGQVRLPSEAAALAVQGSATIGPTLRKAPGGDVAIFVAHDLDFTGVYGLRADP